MTFTYYSPLVRKLTSLFKQINVRIGFHSLITIYDFTKPKNTLIGEQTYIGIYEHV